MEISLVPSANSTIFSRELRGGSAPPKPPRSHFQLSSRRSPNPCAPAGSIQAARLHTRIQPGPLPGARRRAEYVSNCDWGFLRGEMSAIPWVLGDEWDFLDT